MPGSSLRAGDSSSNPKQTTHHLGAELVPMRINELVNLPGLTGDLACRHASVPRLSQQRLALPTKSWEIQYSK